MRARVLVIEDDASLRRGLCDTLDAEGCEVKATADGEEGLELALSWRADLILLDLMLPRVNGYEICRAVRMVKSEVPILMLTAKGQTEDVVKGFELGADDYVVKPFALRELLARVRALLRRRSQGASRLAFGDCYVLDLEARILIGNAREVALTPKEFDLLASLLRQAGRAVSREKLIAEIWGRGLIVTNRSVDRCVKTLRAKLKTSTATQLRSVRGVGYRWDGEVNEGD
jgi:DNA-binding response OmpR family regulator